MASIPSRLTVSPRLVAQNLLARAWSMPQRYGSPADNGSSWTELRDKELLDAVAPLGKLRKRCLVMTGSAGNGSYAYSMAGRQAVSEGAASLSRCIEAGQLLLESTLSKY